MFGVSQTSQSWAQMRGEGEDGIYHTFRGSIVFPSGGKKKTYSVQFHTGIPTTTHKQRLRCTRTPTHNATSQNVKTIKQLSEEQAQRIGSRIVLCSAIVKGVCFCCFIKAGLDAEVGSG